MSFVNANLKCKMRFVYHSESTLGVGATRVSGSAVIYGKYVIVAARKVVIRILKLILVRS